MIGEGNTFYDLTDRSGLPETDVAGISIATDQTGLNAAIVRFDTANHVTLTIDPALTGPITTEYEPPYTDHGEGVVQTNVFVGGQLVAVLSDGTETEIDVLADPRITILLG